MYVACRRWFDLWCGWSDTITDIIATTLQGFVH
jgi:hypothetical protein